MRLLHIYLDVFALGVILHVDDLALSALPDRGHDLFGVNSGHFRGELGAQKALMTLKLKLKGNMVKALRLASLADRLNKVLAKIPTDY